MTIAIIIRILLLLYSEIVTVYYQDAKYDDVDLVQRPRNFTIKEDGNA